MNIFIKKPVICTCLITIVIYALFIFLNLHNHLSGQFGQYLIPGGMYAAPANIEAHGYGAHLNSDKTASGWDGQFYYYLANDPLLQKDTAQHLDMSAYRAQRIGIPLIAYVLSKLIGKDWVSPKLYFYVTVGLILLATALSARWIHQQHYSPYWVLLWSLSSAPFFTLLFGFVDGSADALLILSLLMLVNRLWFRYAFIASLAVLAKESYVLIPVLISLGAAVSFFWISIKERTQNFSRQVFCIFLTSSLPILMGALWQMYLHKQLPANLGLGISKDMMGWPLISIFKTLFKSLPAFAPSPTPGIIVPLTEPVYHIATGLVLLLLMLWVIGRDIYKIWWDMNLRHQPEKLGLLLATLGLTAAYSCLGLIQLWDAVGFTKALSLLTMLYLLTLIYCKKRFSSLFILTSLCTTAYSLGNHWTRVT